MSYELPSFMIPANGVATPQSVARRRKLAETLSSGMGDASPVGHWTQGLARVLQSGVGAYTDRKAADDEAKGKQGASEALSKALMGGDSEAMTSAMGNPWLEDGQRNMIQQQWQNQNDPDVLLGRKMKEAQLKEMQAPPPPKYEKIGDTLVQIMPDGTVQEVYQGQNNEPMKAPSVETFYDEATGQPYNAQWDAATGGWQRVGGTKAPGKGITINNIDGTPNDGELRKKLQAKEGESWSGYMDAATVSGGMMQDMQVLDELIQVAPQGPITGRLAEAFPGFSSAGDAFQSVIKRVAPTLRAPGSGATSDIEYDGMLKSLPALKNNPVANGMISQVMKAKAAINIERGRIISQYSSGEIDAPTARAQIDTLNKRSIMTPDMKKALLGLGGDQAEPQSEFDGMSDEELEALANGQ
jgi:hypothetical protein